MTRDSLIAFLWTWLPWVLAAVVGIYALIWTPVVIKLVAYTRAAALVEKGTVEYETAKLVVLRRIGIALWAVVILLAFVLWRVW